MPNFIDPNFKIVSFDTEYLKKIGDLGVSTKLIIDLNVLNDFENLDKFKASNPEKDLMYREIIYNLRIKNIEIHMDLALVERFFRFEDFNLEIAQAHAFIKKFDSEIASKEDSQKRVGKVLIAPNGESLSSFLGKYYKPFLILYVGCLKIFEISQKGVSNAAALKNIREFFVWKKKHLYVSVSSLVKLSISVFFSHSKDKDLLKINSRFALIEMARNAAFDLLYYQTFLDSNWDGFTSNNDWFIFASQDKKLFSLFESFEIVGEIKNSSLEFNPVMIANFQGNTFFAKNVKEVSSMYENFLTPTEQLPNPELIMEKVILEIARIEQSLPHE